MATKGAGKTYDENVELGIAPAVVPPQSVTFLEHNVSPGYRQYVQTNDSRHLPSKPFGSKIEGQMGSETEELPIQGPPNWTQVWSEWDSIGTDYSQQIPDANPLTQEQWDDLQDMNEQLKNFEFIDLLGKGGFGKVWLLEADREDPDTKTTDRIEMACKVMQLKRKSQISVEEGVREMLADMKMLQHLDHNNIVKYIDVIGIADRKTKFPYSVVLLLMEKCEGDLYTMIGHIGENTGNFRMPENYCKVWFRHIAQAVAYLHTQNVVHMDIKSENIFYKYNDRAMKSKDFELTDIPAITFKLGDFGLATAFPPGEEPTMTGCTRFTENFAAPELIDSTVPVLTKPNDIHCLGVTLVDALIGGTFLERYPYQIAERMTYFLQNQMTGQYGMTESVAFLIYRMTRPNPNDRITADKLLQHNWLK